MSLKRGFLDKTIMASLGTVVARWLNYHYGSIAGIAGPRSWRERLKEAKYQRGRLGVFPLELGPECTSGNAFDLNLLQRNQFSWTAIISEHTRCGQDKRALEICEQIRRSGVKLSSFSFVAALKACSSLQDLESCKKIHAEVLKSGCGSNVFVGSMLVDAYSKCGSLADAWSVFEQIPHRNVVSWNSMIWAYAQKGEGEKALHLYARMQQEGVVPDDRTLVGALKACSSLVALEQRVGANGTLKIKQCLEQVRAIQLHAVKSGCESNVFLGTMLVDVYAKCGHLVDARDLFEKMPHRNVVSWTAMILGYVQVNKSGLALQLYERMQHEGVEPNERTFVGALKACSSLGRLEGGDKADGQRTRKQCLEQVRVIHTQVLKAGLEADIYVGNALVDAYAKCGSVVDARRVFESIPHRDVVSWNTLILAYAQIEKGTEALRLYSKMQQEGMVLDDRTFLGALKACSSLAAEVGNNSDGKLFKQLLEQVRAIHTDLVKGGSKADGRLGNMLVDAYAKCGSLVDARNVFENMYRRDVVSWTAIIVGCAQMEEGQLALQLFARMQKEGVVPNDRTFVGAIKACGSVAALETGKRIHAQILNAGIDATDIFVASSLVDMYGKCGSMVDAQQVFNSLPERNFVTWSALIAGYACEGEIELVFESFRLMVEEGIQPDAITFLSILSACRHVGLVEMGEKYFVAMSRDYGIAATIEHYNCMIDLLGRQGQVDKAIEMVKTMPFQPPSKVWRSVLAACQKWSNVGVGREAFEHAVRLDRSDAGAYILMSNIYAAAAMWKDVEEIRAKSSEVCKDPGQSWWTDITGIMHTFVAEDPESQ